MKTTFLDFEQPIAELEAKIEELRFVQDDSAVDISEEIERLSKKSQQLTKDLYANLTPWQVSQIARHPQRPYTLDYVNELFTDFHELHGDRSYADDLAIVGGLARFNGQPCMVIGQQKGRDTKERAARNFGMPRPEGYRKAERLMRLAEKFGLPIFTFIDTPGAYPGIGAEERGQSEAIGRNLYVMAELKTPIVATIIGEGGSGGALAIAVADSVHFVEKRGEGTGGGRSAGFDGSPAESVGIDRQDRERTAGRRASRSERHGCIAAPCISGYIAPVPRHERARRSRAPLRQADGVRQVQGKLAGCVKLERGAHGSRVPSLQFALTGCLEGNLTSRLS
jgi:hypothetical protein